MRRFKIVINKVTIELQTGNLLFSGFKTQKQIEKSAYTREYKQIIKAWILIEIKASLLTILAEIIEASIVPHLCSNHEYKYIIWAKIIC